MNPSVCTIRSEVSRLFLIGGNRVFSLPPAELAAAYNGTGPEFLPSQIREKLDRISAPFLPAVMVHDVDFTFSDGTVASFRKANARLLVNCVRCALDAHPWHSWRRYALIIEAAAIYRACRRFGWIAWRSAYRKTQTNKGVIMPKLIVLAAIAAALTGCQTRITAEKYAEQVLPVQKVVQVNGQDQLITSHYQIASGGWYATARSPLYATESLEGLDIGVHTNGSVTMSLNKYTRDLSTNSVVMVKEMFSGGAQLVTAIGEAYTKIAGGGAQASTVLEVAQKAYDSFTSAGGDVAKATVTTAGGAVNVSDGSVCTTCTSDGTCTTGQCADK